MLKTANLITDSAQFYNALLQREQEISTGIGRGVAFPHAREGNIAPFVYFIRTCEPLPFNALDGEKVNLFFFIGSKENNEQAHLRVLACSAKLLTDENNKKLLLTTNNENEVLAILRTYYLPRCLIDPLPLPQWQALCEAYQNDFSFTTAFNYPEEIKYHLTNKNYAEIKVALDAILKE